LATYVPAKRATAFRFWVGLVSQADTKKLQSNPTLAAGDVKVVKDGGASANLTTLPAVTPSSSVFVQVDLSATEMTADNVAVSFIDAAGAQWCDLLISIQTTARQVDDLAFPNTSGRGLDVSAGGDADAAVQSIVASAINAAAFNADTDVYQSKLWLFDDDTGTTDRYVVVWFKNGQPITSGITSPTIQVFKAADGADLVASTAMTQIASTGTYRKDEATNRIVDGVAYIAKTQATIDAATRTWLQPVGRDT
jgi:hypothetical protein